MTYFTIPTHPSLASYVRFFWVLEGNASDANPYVHRSMANGCAELVFHYKGRFDSLGASGDISSSFTSGLDGPSRRFRRYRISTDFGIFGAYLYPFAIPLFFGIPASVVSNQEPAMSDLLEEEGTELEEKIMIAKNNHERVAILSAYLQKKLKNAVSTHQNIFSSIQFIIQKNGCIDVDMLARKYFLSTRQFERNFKQYAGFSPKLYSRIIRFQSVLGEYGKQNKTLTEIAYDCGYYDQSHFIHDFKEFSGYHPGSYFSGSAEGTAWRDE